MKKFLHRNWKSILTIVAAFVVMFASSAFRAYHISYDYIRNTAPPPLYSIRFTLHPNNYIDGISEQGFKPGWVVIYAPNTKTYGTGFSVSLFGTVRGSGTPKVVTERLQQGWDEIEKFNYAFAKVDAAVKIGMHFSDAVAVSGQPVAIFTNSDGTLQAFFDYSPRSVGYAKVPWLTNGFTLEVSNGIIVRKGYSYMGN
jgi:hypothetical protein